MAAPTGIEHQWAPGSRYEPTKSADGSEVKGVGYWASESLYATSFLDNLGLLMEVVR
jgi:hypothetical protein